MKNSSPLSVRLPELELEPGAGIADAEAVVEAFMDDIIIVGDEVTSTKFAADAVWTGPIWVLPPVTVTPELPELPEDAELLFDLMEMLPAYISPMSKSTSGRLFTRYSASQPLRSAEAHSQSCWCGTDRL